MVTTLTPHPLLIQMDIFVICSLNLETGNIDYHQIFKPATFFHPISLIAENIYNYFSPPINIISWNVRGTTGTDLKRVFKDLKNTP